MAEYMKIGKLINIGVERIATRLKNPIDRLAYRSFYNFPFGDKPRADADTYRKIWQQAKQIPYPFIDQYEHETGFAIDREWMDDLALLTQVVIKQSDICYQHGRLLYATLSQYMAQHPDGSINILETGTARGFSSLCMAKALKEKQQAGKILTFDVLPHHTKMYWNCIADGQGPQTRAELLHSYQPLIDDYVLFHQGDTKIELDKIEIPRIHFAFLDGQHTYDYAMYEFNYVTKRQKPGDILFFDDYTPQFFPGIVRAVDEICDRHGYSRKIIPLSEQRGYAITQKLPTTS
jgi:predicted O-methyltransferase YrrM